MKLLTHERQWQGGETVIAFGMFDGVHEGHAKLMRMANEIAALHPKHGDRIQLFLQLQGCG